MTEDDDIEILFVDRWSEEEIADLYRQGNWWDESWDQKGIKSLISGSFIFAIALDKKVKKAAGMGRVISDGASDGYIQDLVVRKEYRKKGIGKKILKALVSESQKRGLNWIGLIAEPNTSEFYETEGFSVMKDHIPMLFRNW
ncbi:MAG: GNAT family N-acetyltransferase [Methanomicrobiaceae archaeon]|nr:GNAT family N-acetyltransferase [Methanomicrobiaceae archaeon]